MISRAEWPILEHLELEEVECVSEEGAKALWQAHWPRLRSLKLYNCRYLQLEKGARVHWPMLQKLNIYSTHIEL